MLVWRVGVLCLDRRPAYDVRIMYWSSDVCPSDLGQAFNVFAVNLDQDGAMGRFAVDRAMGGLDQRAFAHAARTPEQGVVGGQAGGKAARIVEQHNRQRVVQGQSVSVRVNIGGNRL